MAETDDVVSSSQAREFVKEIKSLGSMSNLHLFVSCLALLGIVLSFFNLWLGSFTVGLIAGLFLNEEIKNRTQVVLNVLRSEKKLKAILVAAMYLTVLIGVPFFYVGLFAGVGLASIPFSK